MKQRELTRAVFLDRDGVINPLIYYPDMGIVDSPFTVKQFRLFPKVAQAIRLFNDLGFRVIVVSNQPGIAKKHFTAAVLRACEEKLLAGIAEKGGRIDAIYYCLHHPESKLRNLRKECACRKPGIGMLRTAAREWGVSLADSYMIGDGITDIVAGRRAGCQTIFVGRWKCENCQALNGDRDSHPHLVAKDLWAAAGLVRDRAKKLSGPTSSRSRVASNTNAKSARPT